MATARVNASVLGQYGGQVIRIVASVVDTTSSPATFKSTDEKTISVHLNSSLNPERFNKKWVEILGKVQDDRTIIEQMTTPIEWEITPQAWNEMITLMQKHKDIFESRS